MPGKTRKMGRGRDSGQVRRIVDFLLEVGSFEAVNSNTHPGAWKERVRKGGTKEWVLIMCTLCVETKVINRFYFSCVVAGRGDTRNGGEGRRIRRTRRRESEVEVDNTKEGE